MRHDQQFDSLNPLNQTNGSPMNQFLVGAVAGAAVALLLAPKSGREARAWLQDGARHLKDGAGDRFGSVKGAIHDGAEVVKESVEAGKSAYRRAKEETGTSYGA